jgi:hypothetical protein
MSNESKLLGVSVRGWLAVLIIGTVCTMSIMGIEISETLKAMSMAAIGFYWGQKK